MVVYAVTDGIGREVLSQCQISQVLNSLEIFFQEVEPEVDRMGGEGEDRLSLMALMAIFNRVSTTCTIPALLL